MSLEIRSNGQIFIALAGYEHRAVLKEAGFWWHGGPCKPGCKACDAQVAKMWWTPDAAKAARLKDYCNPGALAAIAPILAKTEKSRATHSDIDIPHPIGLAYDGFQKAGVAFVLEAWQSFKGALIADEMGLGKTVQALGLMNWKSDSEQALPPERPLTCAVVCPKSLVLNWKREAEKWLSPDWRVMTYEDYDESFDPEFEQNLLVIWSYSQVEKFPTELTLDMLVFDESHYIKNPDAQRTQQCIPCFSRGKPVEGSGRIAAQADRLLFLTGTPILNRPLELQTLLTAIDPSFAGFWFLKKFCGAHKDANGHWDFSGATNLEELQGVLRTKFMVRRLKKDVYKDLPPKRRSLIPLKLTPQVEEVLEQSPDPSFDEAVSNMDAKRPWGHPAQVRQQLAIAKVDKVVEFVKDLLENTPKVIVFGFTVDAMKQISNALPGSRLIIGDTDLQARQQAVEDFQNKPECRVIVGGYGPMGVGLTLTAASAVVMAEPAWTPAEVSQAEDRAHRRGQTEMVNCYHLVWDGTLEAKMMKLVIAKQDIADKVLDRDTKLEVVEVYSAARGDRIPVKFERPMLAITPEERSLVHRALKYLAARCDGAVSEDGAGFNKLDRDFGHSLAESKALSDKQAHHGKKLIKKYKRQLEAGGISLDALVGV